MTNSFRLCMRLSLVAMSLILARTVSGIVRVPFLALVSSGKRSSYTFPSDGDTSIPIPTRKHGYRKSPFSWSELKQIIVEEQDLAKLSRSIEQEETYQKYRKDLLGEYRSVYDHVLHSKFGFVKAFNEQSRRWETEPAQCEHEVQTVLRQNQFPYYTQSDIEHWVLWKLNGSINDDDVEKARKDLTKQLGNVQDIIYWENPPNLKSLPDINHVHFMVQRNPRQDS